MRSVCRAASKHQVGAAGNSDGRILHRKPHNNTPRCLAELMGHSYCQDSDWESDDYMFSMNMKVASPPLKRRCVFMVLYGLRMNRLSFRWPQFLSLQN